MKRVALVLASVALAVLVALPALAPSAHAAWPTSPNVNLPVRVSTGGLGIPVMISDGAGGAFVAWSDGRNSGVTGDDIYAAHILKGGVMDPAWPVNGVVVCNATGDQETPQLVADNAGGVIVVWADDRNPTWDIYAERLNSNGTLATGWLANGKQIGASTPAGAKDEMGPVACTDGAGGAIVAWTLTYTLNTDYDIYANRVQANGTIAAGWFSTGVPINGSSAIQNSPTIAPDGSGGAIVAYRDDYNTASAQIRYRTVSSSGIVTVPVNDFVRQANGVAQYLPAGVSDGLGGMFVMWQDASVVPWVISIGEITPAGPFGSSFPYAPPIFGQSSDYAWPVQIVPDGNGGVYIAWFNTTTPFHVYVTHITGNATFASGWSVNGASIGIGQHSAIVPDGTGGVLVAYSDSYDVYGTRFLGNGSTAPGWNYLNYISNAPNFQSQPVACSDGAGGMVTMWLDQRDAYRNMTGFYAQSVDRFGALGDASPGMAGVKDTPNDQGGHVRVSWNPSYFDAEPTRGISNYYVYRQLPTHFAVQQVKAGRLKVAGDESAPHEPGTLRVTRDAVTTYYWEQIATVPAMELPGYSLEASTASDSVPGSNPYTLFMVEATANSGAYWMSAPDSGYSKDNLPPLPPAPVNAAYVTGSTTFHWAPNAESDLANYRIYRGTGLSFVPGPGNLIASPTDTSYVDATSSTYIYKLSAVDAHGNESGFTTITASGVLNVAPVNPHILAFAIASQNPSRGRVLFKLTMPDEGEARVALFDAMGRRVRVLTSGHQPAGQQDLNWDGTDDAGRAAASGLYFARFVGAGQTLVRRVVIER